MEMHLEINFVNENSIKRNNKSIILVRDKNMPCTRSDIEDYIKPINSKNQNKNIFFDTQNSSFIMIMTKSPDISYRHFGGNIYKAIQGLHAMANREIILDLSYIDNQNKESILLLLEGLRLRSYGFNKYKTIDRKDPIIKIEVCISASLNIDAELSTIESKVHGVFFARDLVSEPANILYPESYCQMIADKIKHAKLDVKLTILNEKQLADMGMHAILAVGNGSDNKPRVAIMEWKGNPSSSEVDIALIGKGVTFDSGGISIKPSKNMEDMKYDMGGSAIVVGSVLSAARAHLKTNVVGVIGIAENMPSGSAQRPSDVVKSMSGKTIEVINTDAEGRMVLADVLFYAQEKFKPKYLIDFATLTGAACVAMGDRYAAILSNSDELCNKIIEFGQLSDENIWRLPLANEYADYVKSKIADVRNTSSVAGGGTITAAKFLEHFISDSKHWAHVDMAPVAWEDRGYGHQAMGASGFGVLTMFNFIAKHQK